MTIGAIVAGLALAGCGGGDDDETTTAPPPRPAPSGGTPPSSGPGALPPGFAECMAKQGYEIKSSADIHSAPPQVLQECFGH